MTKKTAKKKAAPKKKAQPKKKFTSYDLAGPDPNPMTVEEVDALKLIMQKLSPNIIVNIGAERGTSTLAMLEDRPSAFILSIDVAPCEGEFENIKKAGLDETRVVRLLGRSQDIGRNFPWRVDMIWVDGDHSYEGVKGDIAAWLPRLTKGGVIAFHDYFEDEPPKHNPSGAGQAVRELVEGNFTCVVTCDRIRAYRI